MDSIGIIPPVTLSTPTFPVPSTQGAPEISLPAPAPVALPDSGSFNAQAVDQKRVEAVQHAVQQIANIYVVSDQSFTIYKDASGQYITRYTSLRDGKVTYIPQPTLFKLGGSSADTAPALKIQA